MQPVPQQPGQLIQPQQNDEDEEIPIGVVSLTSRIIACIRPCFNFADRGIRSLSQDYSTGTNFEPRT